MPLVRFMRFSVIFGSQPVPVNLSLSNVGKKFNREWIFRRVNLDFPPGARVVITGGNGSGKSTLLQVISGFIMASEGTLTYSDGNGNRIEDEKIHRNISLASPYLQLPEDLTIAELFHHLSEFKRFRPGITADLFIETTNLAHAKGKYIRQYSSGMKQRLKLAVAFLADTDVLLLDEPLSNLDSDGVIWYKEMVNEFAGSRTIIVCSNEIEAEFYFCTQKVEIGTFKNTAR
jgi:ABC-type multidrug transport system ATPase subunit